MCRSALLGFVMLAAMVPNISFGAIIDFKNIGNGVWSTGIATSNVILFPSAGGTLNAQVDSRYTLVKLPAGCAGVSCQETSTPGDMFGPSTYVVLTGGGREYPVNGDAWLLNDANSSWIGPRADQTHPAADGPTYDTSAPYGHNEDFYVYRMVFNLTLLGINPATAHINLSWLSDNATGVPASNQSHIRMCAVDSAQFCSAGSMIPNSGNTGQGSSSMTMVDISSGFTSGLMALDFVVYNAELANGSGNNPSGLRVVINTAQGIGNVITPPGVPEPGTIGLMALGLLGLCFARRK